MLGNLIATLDNPAVTDQLIAALDDPIIAQRLASAARSAARPACEIAAETVRGFLATASDDHWVQLIGIMNRAEDPGLAAMRAILTTALP
jgi:hypothetical protein